MKNIRYLIIMLPIIFCNLQINKVNIFEHEITRAETHEIYESELPYLDYFDITKYNSVISDRSPAYPFLINKLKKLHKNDLQHIRFSSCIIFYLTLLIMLMYSIKRNKLLPGALSLLLLSTNSVFFYYQSAISPYSLSMLMTTLLLFGYLLSLNSKYNHATVACLSFISTFVFYTSALPALIVIYLLCSKDYKNFIKNIILYVPFFITLLLKGVMILLFRFQIRRGDSGFFSKSLSNHYNDFSSLFNLNLNEHMIHKPIYMIIYCLFFISVLLFLYSSFKNTNDRDDYKLFKFYFVSCFALYFIMSLTGAREIKITYFFGILPLFYFLYTDFIMHFFSKTKTIIIIFLLSSFSIGLYAVTEKINNIKYEPIETISEYFSQKTLAESLICFPEDTSQGEKLWNYFWGTSKVSLEKKIIFRRSNICKKLVNKNASLGNYRHIYIVTFSNNLLCKATDLNNCIDNNYFINELSHFKITDTHIIKEFAKNMKTTISVYKNLHQAPL